MPTPSSWTLTPGAVRFFVPRFMQNELGTHPLTEALYPNGFGYYPNAHGHQMQREEHEDNLVLYCTAGRGRLQLPSLTGQSWQDIRAGDIVLLPRGTPHRYQADEKSPWTVYWVHFDGSNSDKFIAHLGGSPCRHVIKVGISLPLNDGFNRLFNARDTGYSLPVFIQASQTLAWLLAASATLSIQHAAPDSGNEAIAKAASHMLDVIDGQIDLDALAAIAGLSKYHFIKKYRQIYGYTPIQHFIHRKMERASQLLDTTTLSINEVALRLGYEDPLYFSRIFRKITGYSPRQYRQLGGG